MKTWLSGIYLLHTLVSSHFTIEDQYILQHAKTNKLVKELCELQQSYAAINQCKCKESNTVAFQAEASTSLSDFRKNAVVIFDKVAINVGNAYDPKTGIFTAPDDGVYSFTWTVMSKPGSIFHTEFALDGNSLTRGYLDLQASKNHFSSTKNILVEMKKKNKAWVQVHGDTGKYLSGGHNGLSTFNGYRI